MTTVPAWVTAMFWVGALVALGLALLYASIFSMPSLAGVQGNPQQLRTSAALIAVWAAALFGAQVVAAVGLTGRRRWAMLPATLACVGWALTCLGLPVAVLVLAGLWRGRRPGP